MDNLIILHGALGSKDQFQNLADLLSDVYDVHPINLAGHGGDQSDCDFTITNFVDSLVNKLKTDNISPPHIFGYSLGGYVAIELALRHPSMVKSIFTLATKFDWTHEVAEKEVKMLDAEKLIEKVPAFAKTLEQRHAPADWKRLLQKTAAMMRDLGGGSKPDFQSLSCPVRYSVGDRDTMVSIEETLSAYRITPNASLTVFADTAHPIEKVRLEKLRDELVDFFNPIQR